MDRYSTTKSVSLRLRPTAAKAIVKAVELLYAVDAVDFSELQATRIALSALVRGELSHEPEDKLVSQEQVAAAFGVGLSTLKRLLATGQVSLPRKTVGGSIRYRWKDVVSYINLVDVEQDKEVKPEN